MALEDKTEAATPRRRQEAREEGQVARSVELSSAMVLLACLLILKFVGPGLGEKIQGLLTQSLTSFPRHDLTANDVSSSMVRILLEVGVVFAPFLLGIAVVGFASSVLQVGFVFSGKALQPKGERLNPISGISRMFSTRSIVELGKAIAKIMIVSYIVYSFVRDKYAAIVNLVGCDYKQTCSQIGQLSYEVMLRATIAMFVIAALDYMYQKFQHEKQMKMTKQEVRDDTKRTEGDPLIKSKIRQRQREISQRRMMQEVPRADVVVTNPTHFAVAIKYDPDTSAAPVVVAKGQDLVAKRIKEIALDSDVPIVENKPLARALYASVEIGNEVPAELYQAMAEILAYVYRLSGRAA